jgi:hypothetical protein
MLIVLFSSCACLSLSFVIEQEEEEDDGHLLIVIFYSWTKRRFFLKHKLLKQGWAKNLLAWVGVDVMEFITGGNGVDVMESWAFDPDVMAM